MMWSKFTIGLLALMLVCSVRAEEVESPVEDTSAELSVSELLDRANRDIVRDFDEPQLIGGDIAIDSDSERNADPCTSRGCLWPKYNDGKVYVPYVIANHYSSRELSIIQRGLDSFASSSCIRFKRRTNERDYISIESRNGCYSYVGRRGYAQTVSLSRQGCLYHSTVQHELLHALGFNHEQTRNDRDNYIRVYWENIIDDMKYNFNKINTLNQGTAYDYNSVMQYERYAFSKNNRPTMVPIPNSNVVLGKATQMSNNDITRLNRLYKCCKYIARNRKFSSLSSLHDCNVQVFVRLDYTGAV
ncbi:high choriolytic enzyme 1-like [Chanos chanos]|uniref:Metalloendopeptidase n=1 Tax=Chanos chanos TaxID=29144 RepID=A0A6J2X018_CHACN|nr:high choriolytic enzyme 1-like [Chanos chanos]